MANDNGRFYKIESFKELEAEKTRLHYEKEILKHKIKIRRMEMSMYLNPSNLIPALFSGLVNNLISGVRSFLGNIFR